MFEILYEIEVSEFKIQIIRTLYTNEIAEFKVGKSIGEARICKRVRQECVMSPALFNIYPEKLINIIKNLLKKKERCHTDSRKMYINDEIRIRHSYPQ